MQPVLFLSTPAPTQHTASTNRASTRAAMQPVPTQSSLGHICVITLPMSPLDYKLQEARELGLSTMTGSLPSVLCSLELSQHLPKG